MKVIKYMSVLFIFLLSMNANAQRTKVNAGLAFSNFRIVSGGTVFDDSQYKLGGQLGGFIEVFNTNFVSIWTGGMFGTKGYRTTFTLGGPFGESTYYNCLNLFYLDIPVFARADFGVGNLNFYGLFGPYAGIGLFGQNVTKVEMENSDTEKSTSDVEWGDDGLKRFDAGLFTGVGTQFNRFEIELALLLGLTNIVGNDISGAEDYSRSFRITLGYLLNEGEQQ